MMEAIFLSASVPDPRRSPAHAKTADTVSICSAVTALVHVALGRRMLVWGGHPAITPMISGVAEDLGVDYGRWVHLYQSRYFEDEYPEDNERFDNVTFVDVGNDRESSLTEMRRRMLSDYNFSAGVFIGGMDGVILEYGMFCDLQSEAEVIPVASTGGASLEVAALVGPLPQDLFDDLDYVSLFHRYLNISVREERFQTPDHQPSDIEDRYWRPTLGFKI